MELHHHEKRLFEGVADRGSGCQDLIEAFLNELRHLQRMELGAFDTDGYVTQPAGRLGIGKEVVSEERSHQFSHRRHRHLETRFEC
ncbi:hypothetical protein ABIC08_008364 [Bradyrhizobium sp. RT9b]